MTDKLKPCPFCGGEALKKSYDRLIQIGCENCGYTRGFCGIIQSKIDTGVPIRYKGGKISTYEWYDKDAEEKAIAAWNTRKPIEAIIQQLVDVSYEPENFEYEDYKVVDLEEAIAIVKGVQNE